MPDEDWRFFGGNTHRIWILQTFLRLRDAGYPVRLTNTLPTSGVVVVGGASRKHLFKDFCSRNRALIVAVRADHRPQLYADLEVVQNDHGADGRSIYVPHWPQPGLIPRDADRGAELKTVSFKGHSGCLHDDFKDGAWGGFLEASGLTWQFDGVEWHGGCSRYEGCEWTDYRTVDAVLAVRNDWHDSYLTKPASKLVNAWHAGVPAIVGPDYAFLAERRSELDFLLVHSLDEAREAVTKLKQDPALYQAMVENGRQRAREITSETVTARWAELLFEVCAPLALARSRQRLRLLHWWSRVLLYRSQHLSRGIRGRRRSRERPTPPETRSES
ncbi:MAG: glycosyltransferase family 1 protein [Planctomycetes bacterium]|nr:glycosyltransferase family 1 protein [Planctomycetota bacterium]